MNLEDLQKHAIEEWEQFKETVTVISKPDNKNTPLVESNTLLYNFDKICESIHGESNKPTSADALAITQNKITLIEFKTGFKRIISVDTIDDNKLSCPHTQKLCVDYKELLLKNSDKEKNELFDSIRFKVIESYITLEKHIFPLFPSNHTNINLEFIVVTDENSDESMEYALAELSKSTDKSDSTSSRIKTSLKRFLNKQDASCKPYYYNHIDVLSVSDFSKILPSLSQ